MTFTVPRKPLAAELALLQTVSERKATIPVLSTVMLGLVGDTLTLTATGLDATLITEIQASGDSYGGCVPSQSLHDLVRLLEGDEVRFTPKSNQRLELSAGKSRHLLPVAPIAEFPRIERPSGEGFSLPLAPLTGAIKATAFSMLDPHFSLKPDELRFTGLSLRKIGDHLEVMATRKFVTAIAEIALDVPEFSVVLPPQSVDALARMEGESVHVRHNESLAEFTAGNRTVVARQLTGQFPQWRQFVPEYQYQMKISSERLAAAVRRASITSETDPLKATFAGDTLTVETQDGNHGQSQEPVTVTSNLNGDAISLGVFGDQILSVLAQCEGEIECSVVSEKHPLLIRPDSQRNYIITPVRLKW